MAFKLLVVSQLLSNQNAANAADGIKQWRLARIGLEEASAEVERALENLAHGEIVVSNTLPDGNVMYKRMPPARRNSSIDSGG